jgi:rsbT co-antagonist protein RsbR
VEKDEPESPAALKARIAQLEQELKNRDELFKALVIDHPDAVVISDMQGSLTQNAEVQRIFGQQNASLEPGEWVNELFQADSKTPFAMEEMPLMRAMRGENVQEITMVYRPKRTGQEYWLSMSARPLRDGSGQITGGISVFRDVTDRKLLERDLETRAQQLAESEAAKSLLIERLRAAVEELSTPVLELWDDVVALPVIGVLDSQRGAEMSERLLAETTRLGARFVILDVTGVEVVDTAMADCLVRLAKSVELLGAQCFITGLQPAVARTMVEQGVDFGTLRTPRNLKYALKLSMTLREAKDTGAGATARRG